MTGFLTLGMVKGGITRDAFTQKVAATGTLRFGDHWGPKPSDTVLHCHTLNSSCWFVCAWAEAQAQCTDFFVARNRRITFLALLPVRDQIQHCKCFPQFVWHFLIIHCQLSDGAHLGRNRDSIVDMTASHGHRAVEVNTGYSGRAHFMAYPRKHRWRPKGSRFKMEVAMISLHDPRIEWKGNSWTCPYHKSQEEIVAAVQFIPQKSVHRAWSFHSLKWYRCSRLAWRSRSSTKPFHCLNKERGSWADHTTGALESLKKKQIADVTGHQIQENILRWSRSVQKKRDVFPRHRSVHVNRQQYVAVSCVDYF